MLHNIVVYHHPCVWWRAELHKYHESTQCQFFCKCLAWGERLIFTFLKMCALEGKYKMSSVLMFLIFWERFFMKLQKNTRKIRS